MATRKPFTAQPADTVDFDEVMRRLDAIPSAKPAASPERSTLRAVGDLASQFAGGAVSGVRMMTDLVGADNRASQGLRSAEEALRSLQSATAKADQQEIARIMQEAEGKGWGEQIALGLKAFGVAPGAMMAQALGTSLPTLATAAIPGVGPAAVATRLGMAGAIGGAQGAGNIKGVIYEQVKEKLAADPTLTPEQVEARAVEAQSYGGENAGQIALGGGLGVLAGSTGMERAVSGLRNGATRAAPGMLARVGMGAATEAFPEALQGGQEKFASNTALVNEGFDVDPWSGVAAQSTMEAAAGAAMGGAFGVPNPGVAPAPAGAPPPAPATPTAPPAGPLTRAANAGGLGTRLTQTPMADLLGGNVDPLAGQLTADRQAQEDAALLASNTTSLTGSPMSGMLGGNADPLQDILSGRRQAVQDMPSGMAERTGSTDAQPLDLPTADPVANYVDDLRQVNTPAARAFVRDFDAGAITPDDVQQRMARESGRLPGSVVEPVGVRAGRSAQTQEALAAERELASSVPPLPADQMPPPADPPQPTINTVQPGDVLNPANGPFKTRVAVERAAKANPGQVIEVPGGFVIRPQQAPAPEPADLDSATEVPPVEAPAPAAPPAAPPAPLTRARTIEPGPAVVLQNRDRSSAASVAQMNDIAAKPDYLRAGPARVMDSGAPVVFGDAPETALVGREETVADGTGQRTQTQYMVVEAADLLTSNLADGTRVPEYEQGQSGKLRAVAGNGRAAGLSEAYNRGTANQYRADLLADAQALGIEPAAIEAMRAPVLVRVMSGNDVTADMGDRSNIAGTARLSAVEQASTDARRIDLSALEFDEAGDPTPESVRKFTAGMPTAERGELLNKDGSPTRQAIDRLMAASFKQAYGSDDLVQLYAQATDEEARTVMAALADAAGAMAGLSNAGDLDIRGAVTEAAGMAVNARRRGLTLANMLQNADIETSGEAFVIARFFAENIRSAKKMAEGLRNWANYAAEQAQIARENQTQDGLFGAAPVASRADIFKRIENGQVPKTDARQPARQEPVASGAQRAPDDASAGQAGAATGSAAATPASAEAAAEGLTAPTQADIEAQQERTESADKLGDKDQIKRESEVGDTSFMTGFAGDGRQDTTGGLFDAPAKTEPAATPEPPAPEKAIDRRNRLIAERKAGKSLTRPKGAKAGAAFDAEMAGRIRSGEVSADGAEAAGVSTSITWPAHRAHVFSKAPEMTRREFHAALKGRHGMAGQEIDAYYESSGGKEPRVAAPATQETGPFGPILTRYRGDAQGAIQALTQLQSGEAVAALNHPEVGDIDLVWGETSDNPRATGFGLAKLKRWHPEVLGDLQGFISRLSVKQKHNNKIHLQDDLGGRASVQLDWDGERKTWLLTAYEKSAGKGTSADTAQIAARDDTARPGSSTESSVPPAAPDAQADAPKLTQAEAAELMTWQDMGTKDGVKRHILTFYPSKADAQAKTGRMTVATVTKGERNATAWMVDGDDQTFGSLSLAKKRAMEAGMAKAKTDGFVQMSALEQALGADVLSRPVDRVTQLRKQAEELSAQARKMLDGIAPGQPIMSARDRNLRERSGEKMRKAAELNAQADALERPAATSAPAAAPAPAAEAAPADVPSQPDKADDAGNVAMFSRSPMKSIDANVRRGMTSLARALDEKTSVNRAMFRNGLGWVDFVWGSEGTIKASGKTKGAMGLSHIIEARQRKDGLSDAQVGKLLGDIVATIAQGTEVARREYDAGVNITLALGGVEVILIRNKGSNAWLMNGWNVKNPDAVGAGYVASDATLSTPTTAQRGKGAEFADIVRMANPDVNLSRARATTGLPVSTVQQVAGLIRARWANAPEIIVVQNMNDPRIDKAVRDEDARQRQGGAKGSPRGFFLNGKVYLVADSIASTGDAVTTLFHEAIGHAGLRGVFGKELGAILDQLATMRRAEIIAKAREYGLVRKDANGDPVVDVKTATNAEVLAAMDQSHKRVAAEEVLADFSQTRPEIGFVQRAIAAIRAFLRKNVPGFQKMKLTDNDIIQQYLMPARAWVERGGVAGGRAGEARFNRSTGPATKRSDYAWQAKGKTADGQRFYEGPGFTLEQTKAIDQDDFGDSGFAMHGMMGHAARVVPNTKTFGFQILGVAGENLGLLVADVDASGAIRSVHDIVISSRQSGLGAKIVQHLAANSPQPLRIQDVTNEAEGFWNKLGLGSLDPYRDANLDWEGAAAYGESGGRATAVDGVPGFAGEAGADSQPTSEDLTDEDAQGFFPGVMFSRTGNGGAVGGMNGNATTWDAPTDSKWDDYVFKLQDKNIDLKRVTQSITKWSGALADNINAYLQEELYHGRSAKRVQDFSRMEMEPALKELAAGGYQMADLEEFMHARHAPEANAVMAQRNPTQPMIDAARDAAKAEIDRLEQAVETSTGPTQKQFRLELKAAKAELKRWRGAAAFKGTEADRNSLSGMSNQAAAAYFANLSPDDKAKLGAVAAKMDAIMAQTTQLMVDYGLESQETVNGWAAMYQHYIPLHREDKEDSRQGTGQGFSVKGRETRGRTGSTRKVVDVIAHIAAARERAIVRGEKNRVAQALVGMAQAYPNEDLWKVGPPEYERVFNPSTGKVENRVSPTYKSLPNVVLAKVVGAGGEVNEVAITFNENNERAVRMAAALKNLDAARIEGMLGTVQVMTRYFASINTQYNPIFGIVNLLRDVQGTMINLGATPLADKKAVIARDAFSALAGIYQDVRATRKGGRASSQWSQLFEQFQQDGGQTGFRALFETTEDRASELNKILDPDGWSKSGVGKFFTADGRLTKPIGLLRGGFKVVFDWLSDYNEAMESGVRLATYKAALDKGMSREQAASLAKNITVNFNRKGQVGNQMGAVYAFFNAAMQGTARMGETLMVSEPGKPKTMRLSKFGKKVVYGGMTLGVVQALALAAAGFDDEEPPLFLRERSLIFPTGWSGIGPEQGYVSIPMPLGLHVIPGIGRMSAEFALGGFQNPAKHAARALGMFADAFNPIGNAGLSMQTLAPTVLDPLVALTENKDWTGKPIARVSMNKDIPGFTQHKDTASVIAKFLAESINTLSGGNDYVAGVLSPTPDQIDYLLGQLTGGVGRELSKVEQTITSSATGEELPVFKVPLVGRFVGNASGKASESSTFYTNSQKLNRLETEIKGMVAAGKLAEARELRAENPQARLMVPFNAAERQVQKLRKQKSELVKAGGNAERVREIEDRTAAIMARMNGLVRQLEAAAVD